MSPDPDEERLLDMLVRWDELRQQGVDVSAETLCQSCPELAEEVRRHIRRHEAFEEEWCPPTEPVAPPSDDDNGRPTADGPPDGSPAIASCTHRYRLLRFHARGGLGQVSIARDEVLDREVALKEIQPGLAHDAERRSRFLLEAQVTGNLEHPGIVPVYGLGTFADGRPFYAMRFISDETLDAAIQRFHSSERAEGWGPGERSLAFRGLLSRLIDVANAVAYAHSRGVLHRDLKPSNVMLGPYGETLVVDWGLAKVIGRTPAGGDGSGDGEPGACPPLAREMIETIPGAAFGTPAYMSPEQAVGDLARIGPASDIYSLGATLYCLLTGRAPFRGSGEMPLLRRVESGEFPRPRDVAPKTPAALEAICLKAMALRPEDRYATPREMADDIEHWLADEPVSAHREGRAERLSRWMRRHRTWARAAAAALVLVAVVSTVAAVAVERAWSVEHQARQTEQLARYEAGVQRDRARDALREADANFATAREAVNRLLSQLAQARLAAIPEAEKLRRQVAADAAEFNERFLRMRPDDPAVQLDAARVFREVANIDRMLGQFPQSVAAYTRSIDLLESLAGRPPEKPEYRDRLAETLLDAGEGLRADGRPRDAEPFYRRAIALEERLLAGSPDSVAFRRTKADGLIGLAAALAQLGREAEAEELGAQAVALIRPLGGSDRASYLNALLLAMMLKDWGKSLREVGRSHEAEPPIVEAIGRLTALRDGALEPQRLGKIPEAAIRDNAAFILALAQNELGLIVSVDPARRAEAERAFDAAIVGLGRLGASRSPIPRRREALGLAYLGRGSLRAAQGRTREAGVEWGEARRLLAGLVAEFPHNASFRGPLGLVLGHLARPAVAAGDVAAARLIQKEAVEHLRRALEANPDHLVYRQALSQLLEEIRAAEAPTAPRPDAREGVRTPGAPSR